MSPHGYIEEQAGRWPWVHSLEKKDFIHSFIHVFLHSFNIFLNNYFVQGPGDAVLNKTNS